MHPHDPPRRRPPAPRRESARPGSERGLGDEPTMVLPEQPISPGPYTSAPVSPVSYPAAEGRFRPEAQWWPDEPPQEQVPEPLPARPAPMGQEVDRWSGAHRRPETSEQWPDAARWSAAETDHYAEQH